MANKLDRLRLELKKAREKRDEWAARTEALEQKVTEEENLQICDLVRSVSLTTEALAELLCQRIPEASTKEDTSHGA